MIYPGWTDGGGDKGRWLSLGHLRRHDHLPRQTSAPTKKKEKKQEAQPALMGGGDEGRWLSFRLLTL